MINIVNKGHCSGCGACACVCPKKCIKMVEDNEGFLYPKVNTDECISCGLCEKVCPFSIDENKFSSASTEISAFAFKSMDDEIRMNSSSGGAFSLLSEYVINSGGIVYGVALSENCRTVRFECASTKEDLKRLRGSKYIQADASLIYKDVLEKLNEGILVLFSGVPCQINGLRLYLKKEYPNLYCVDIICHGVPSGKLWKKYIDEIENKYGEKVKNVNFRFKNSYNARQGIKILGNKRLVHYNDKSSDLYFRLFLNNLSLRPSCYECKAKKVRYADITLGDFWGINKTIPNWDDGKGISVVIIRSPKGGILFDNVKAKGKFKEVEYESAVLSNTPEYKPVKRPEQRDNFYLDIDNLSMIELNKKYLPESIAVKTGKSIKRLARRIKSLRGGV